MNGNGIRTFLSANTPKGFFSFFNEFAADKDNYIIKGGPGTGKSGLMKKVAGRALTEGFFVEYVYCSSDPDSLDAVYVPEKGFFIADGTPPHVLEPKFPGACGGMINLGECWDDNVLRRNKDDVKQLNGRIAETYKRAYRYMNAAADAFCDIRESAEKYIIGQKAENFINRLISTTIKKRRNGEGSVFRRFLSGVTPKGFLTFKDTIYTLCSKVVPFSDGYCISPIFINAIKDAAVASGYDVYLFYSPICPEEAVHVAIPELDTAFVTSNRLASFDPENARSVNIRRFLSPDISSVSARMRFDSRLMTSCLDRAVEEFRRAKALHDDLEEIYIAAMDYGKVDRITIQTVSRLFGTASEE